MSGIHTKHTIGAIVASSGILGACAPDATTTQSGAVSGTFICLWNCGNVTLTSAPDDRMLLAASILAVIGVLIAALTVGRPGNAR